MVAHLVRDDVGLGEVARRPEALVELPEEGDVEVDLAVGRAVERARPPPRRCRRPSRPARRRGPGSAPRSGLRSSGRRSPGGLGVLQHDADELGLGVVGRRRADRSLLLRSWTGRHLLDEAEEAQQLLGIGAREHGDDETTRRPRQPKPAPRPPGTRIPRRSSTLSLCSRPCHRMGSSGLARPDDRSDPAGDGNQHSGALRGSEPSRRGPVGPKRLVGRPDRALRAVVQVDTPRPGG